MNAKDKAWSGDMYELTWFFFRSDEWEIIHFYRVQPEKSKYVSFALKVSYWGIHVAYTKD